MRLSDAEALLGPGTGMRVHRSWWVALDHVTGTERTAGGGMDLITSNGLRIPVARGQRAELRAVLERQQPRPAEQAAE